MLLLWSSTDTRCNYHPKSGLQGLAGDLVEGFPDMLLKTPGLTEESTVMFFDT